MLFPRGAPSFGLYIQPFSRHWTPNILGHDLDRSRSCDRISHVTIQFAMSFTIGGPLEPRLCLTVCEIFVQSQKPTCTHIHFIWKSVTGRQTERQMYFVPCNVLHWIDKKSAHFIDLPLVLPSILNKSMGKHTASLCLLLFHYIILQLIY